MGRDIGRLGQLLVGEEAVYGTTPALLATMALRHLSFKPSYNPKNRVWSDEKKSSRGRKARFDRAVTAGFDLEAYLRPSGTIGTIPEAHKLLQHGFGTTVVGTLDTLVVAAPPPSTTVFSVTAASGLNVTVGEWIIVKRAGNGNIPEARVVTNKNVDELTVSPALGGAPAAGDVVKAGVTYKLGTIAKSLSFVHFLTNMQRTVKGGLANQLKLTLDRNAEVVLNVTGPAQQAPKSALGNPGFTTIGAQNPPSGLVGGMLINGTAYKFLKLEIDHDNALDLISENYGTLMAEGFDEPSFRELTFSLDARVTDDFALYILSESAAQFELFAQTGQTQGNIVAIRAPKAELEGAPDYPDDNGPLTYGFKGVFAENTGDDEWSLGLL